MQLKSHFSRFLGAYPQRLHFSAHSHHPWPDVSFEAHQQAWLDAAQRVDQKWDKVFGEVLPQAQRHVARVLNLPDPRTICFAPSTHELVVRLISALPQKPLRVLTTDSEFHSFTRQMRRLEEEGSARVQRVAVEPYASFAARFAETAAAGGHDLVYFSQCFYNTGFLVEHPGSLVRSVRDPKVPVVIDGYHAFMAVPTDLATVASRAFYTAGGYKYAMGGEGVCFMHCPPGFAARPVNTGWFAGFSGLSKPQALTEVPYSPDGQRFMGSTYDPTGLYRFNAVQDWLQRLGVGVPHIRNHVLRLQQRFMDQVQEQALLPGAQRVPPAGTARGNFYTFRHPQAADWYQRLLEAQVTTDYRDDRLRIGFGLYQEPADVDALATRLAQIRL